MQDLGWKIQWLSLFEIEVLWLLESSDKAEQNGFIDKSQRETESEWANFSAHTVLNLNNLFSGALEVKIKLPHDSKCIVLGLRATEFTMLCNAFWECNQELCGKRALQV